MSKLMKTLITLIVLLLNTKIISQSLDSYVNSRGERHLVGAIPIDVLETDTTYQKWFLAGYEAYDPEIGKRGWTKELKDVKVTIFMATWCGDTKYLVPRFIKLWDQLGLERSQIQLIGLYGLDQEEKYKQGPDGEEKDRNIHRVATIIFEKNEIEIGRIVEFPATDLVTDMAQIALGFPPAPSYHAANYMLAAFDQYPVEVIRENLREHYLNFYKTVTRRELNTLGYVLMDAGKIEEAILIFGLNMMFFPYDHNVYDSYAEALARNDDIKGAIEYYERVLLLDRNNEHAREMIGELEEILN